MRIVCHTLRLSVLNPEDRLAVWRNPLKIRKHFIALFLLSLCFAFPPSQLRAQEALAASADKKPMTSSVPDARTKDGKRLLGALDLMKLATVAAPRISPDGSRVAYTVGEVKM